MAICPHCSGEHSSVEESGLRMHKFSDRWISCSAGAEEAGKEKPLAPMRSDLLRLVLASSLVLIRTIVTRMPAHSR
jgi:hypothetical protein